MISVLLLTAALMLCAVGCLTVLPSPDWAPWKLAVVAGEYGHRLALTAAAIALAVPFSESDPRMEFVILGCAGFAALLLLKPTWQAARVAAALPERLERPFGRGSPAYPPFSVGPLFWGRAPRPAPSRTRLVSPDLPLDFYPPVARQGAGPAPCVVVVHGGGWDAGDRKQVPQFNHWLAHRGYAVAAVSYRLAPRFRWPAQRDDLVAALAHLKSHAAELAIDPARFVLIGRSAGAQIAQMVAYTADDPAIRGVVALYSPSDLVFGYENTHENDLLRSRALMRQYLGGTPESARAIYDSASPICHVRRGTPPTLLLHGLNDTLVWCRHSERLEARLAEAGVPSAFVALPWATHAFEYNLHGPGGQLATYAIDWFLARVTE